MMSAAAWAVVLSLGAPLVPLREELLPTILVQAEQAVWPGASWYRPASQWSQAPSPAWGWAWPGLHSE